MDLYLNHRSWYLIICITIALIYAVFLYVRDIKSNDQKKWIIFSLLTARFTIVFVLLLFLLEPVFKQETVQLEKPIVVFAQDNSESILINKDSSYYNSEYKNSIIQFLDRLKKHYDVQTFSFGSSVKPELRFDFKDKTTNFGNLFDEINNRYYGRNLGGVIIASDGIINAGRDPLYAKSGIGQTNLYAIALGDTNYQKDVSIQKVLSNKVVGYGNLFPVDVHLLSKKMQGNSIDITIYKQNEIIETKKYSINEAIDASTIKFLINADESGKIKYNVKISEISGEITHANNYFTFYVDVLDKLQKVLILANAPHPDIGAIRSVISDKFKRDIDVQLINDFNEDIEDYDLIILHKAYLKNSNKISDIIKTSRAAKIPILHITGSTIDTDFFNELSLGLNIDGHEGKINALPIFNNDFSSFIVNKKMNDQVEQYPPLAVPFVANYKKNISTNVLMYQEINGQETDYPMILLNDHPNVREALIIGEGLWRWKMNEFLNSKDKLVFSELFSKITQYVISNDKKDRFAVDVESDFNENESIHFYAEIYNKNYELINDAQIEIDLTNDSGYLFKKSMIKNGDNYELHINKLPPGKYLYKAKTTYGKEYFEKEGTFNVHQIRLEVMNTKADFAYLNQLMNLNNGKVYLKDKINELEKEIIGKKIPSVSHRSSKLEDIIKWKWLFLIISLLLFIEWFSRKRIGLN